MSNTKTIAKNTGWYGLENVISSVITIFTSIAIARTLGPTKMGYIIYVIWIAGVVSGLGSIGIPATTSKYMAEFIGKGDKGTARFIYFRTGLVQICMATIATIGILIWALHDAQSDYRIAATLIVLSIWPTMVNFISAQANAAMEQLSANLPASVISTFVYFLCILATVVFKWGVIGVAASFFNMRVVDFLVRLFPTLRRILTWDKTESYPPGLARRMMIFSIQSVATLVIALIVWNRSELMILKHLCPDIRQVAFYSVAFSLADRLLISSSVFGSSTATTMFAQYGRDRSRLSHIAASSFRYLALTAIPVHTIATALAAPALLFLYGAKYQGALAVVTLAPLLCMPKAFIGPVVSLLQSTEKQTLVITSTLLAGVVDIAVAWYLIPSLGAVGACIGSGAAQIMAIGMMWTVAIRVYEVTLPWIFLAKVCAISILAALAAHYIGVRLSPVWAIILGGTASLVVLLVLIRLMRVLEPEDRHRFRVLAEMLPKPLRTHSEKLFSALIRPSFADVTPTNV